MVWQRFGDVQNFVDPFFGSGAVLLGRQTNGARLKETVNDLDGYLCNFWRALAADPDAIAHYTDWPVNENDLHARHAWLVRHRDELSRKLEGDPDFYDAKIAGWWVWGINCWIGGEFCSGKGPWQVVDGQLVHLGNTGRGVHRKHNGLLEWMRALAERLRYVRVCCGDWARVVQPAVTVSHGLTAVFLDPPYGADAKRDSQIYSHDSLSVAQDVRAWCLENGHDSRLRIALCGYAGEGHEVLESQGWAVVEWKADGGMMRTEHARGNRKKERIWFSPHCVDVGQLELF